MNRPPAEFIGRARDLRRRIAAADVQVQPAMRRVLMPIQRRLERHPVVRKETLIDAERAWRALLAFGRIGCCVDISNRRAPEFADVRVCPGEYRGLGWDSAEAGIVVVMFSAGPVGTGFALAAVPVATVSLHGLARRYQRASSLIDDATVLHEIGRLALDFPKLADAGGEVAWAVSGGVWRGHVVETQNDEVVLSIRTFIDTDTDAPALAA